MKTLILISICAFLCTKSYGQQYYFDCVTAPARLPLNNIYDSIIMNDTTGWRYIDGFTVALTSSERKDKLEEEHFPINSHRLYFSPNADFTAFSIDGFCRNSYFNITTPYSFNFAFEPNDYSEKGHFNLNNTNIVVRLYPLLNMKIEKLSAKVSDADSMKLFNIVKYHFQNNITNYTEYIPNDSNANIYSSLSSNYFKYENNPELKNYRIKLNYILQNGQLHNYASPKKGSRVLNKYERTHNVDTAFYDNTHHLIPAEREQIGFKIVTDFKFFNPTTQFSHTSSNWGFTNNISFIGLVFRNKFNVSETVWFDISEIKKYVGLETTLIELKFLLKRQIEQRM